MPKSRRTAPTTSLRPRARPDDLAERYAPPQPQIPEQYGKAGPTAGMYDGLGIEDKTDEFGELGAKQRRGDPSEVILHQTMSETGASTEGAYENRIKKGSHTGAHYLIDEEGETSLTVPTDEVVYHAVGHNNDAIGIENVGMPEKVSQRSDMHQQIEALDLSPKLKARLLAMSERELKQTLSSNGNYIYKDINGPQKRANWNLLRAISAEHGIELEADVESHEHVQAKTIGEGENIEEFVDAMLHWPKKLDQLEARIAELEASGEQPGKVAEMKAELTAQREQLEAVKLDKSMPENNALEGELILGEPGPASAREETREQFWDDFYPTMQRLDDWLKEPAVEGMV